MISMITNRTELYQRIWEDYCSFSSDKKQNSYFYIYMKEKKDAYAKHVSESAASLSEYCARKKRDKYIMLRSAYLAYKKKNPVISEADYIRIFNSLFGEKQRRKYVPLTPENIEIAEQIYEREFLLGCINDFFYNLGYRLRKNKENTIEIDKIGYVKKGERYLKEQDGYIDDLELWSDYLTKILQGEPQPPKFVSELTEEYIGKCSDLFDALNFDVLNREERRMSFLPLYFDAVSGAGVIVIGNEWLPENKRNEKACRICIIYFSGIYDGIDDFNDISLEMIAEPVLFDNVSDAFERFKKGVVRFDYTDNYGSRNGNMPDGIDSIFNCLFFDETKGAIDYDRYDRMVEAGFQEESDRFSERQQEKNERLERVGIEK